MAPINKLPVFPTQTYSLAANKPNTSNEELEVLKFKRLKNNVGQVERQLQFDEYLSPNEHKLLEILNSNDEPETGLSKLKALMKDKLSQQLDNLEWYTVEIGNNNNNDNGYITLNAYTDEDGKFIFSSHNYMIHENDGQEHSGKIYPVDKNKDLPAGVTEVPFIPVPVIEKSFRVTEGLRKETESLKNIHENAQAKVRELLGKSEYDDGVIHNKVMHIGFKDIYSFPADANLSFELKSGDITSSVNGYIKYVVTGLYPRPKKGITPNYTDDWTNFNLTQDYRSGKSANDNIGYIQTNDGTPLKIDFNNPKFKENKVEKYFADEAGDAIYNSVDKEIERVKKQKSEKLDKIKKDREKMQQPLPEIDKKTIKSTKLKQGKN